MSRATEELDREMADYIQSSKKAISGSKVNLIVTFLQNNSVAIVTQASEVILQSSPELESKGIKFNESARNIAVLIRDFQFLFSFFLRMVAYSISKEIQPTQLKGFKKVREKIKESFITNNKFTWEDIKFAVEVLKSTITSSIESKNLGIDSDSIKLLKKYLDSIASSLLTEDSEEESSSGLTEENKVVSSKIFEEKVMEEDLMDLSDDEEFLNAVSRIRKQRRASSDKYYLSMGDRSELAYRYNKAKNRGELETFKKEQDFIAEQLKIINPCLNEPVDFLNKKERNRYRSLMREQIKKAESRLG